VSSDDDRGVRLLVRFVLRARRVLECRFATREDLPATVPQEDRPSSSHMTITLADEESLDAAAARIRPLLLGREDIYWEKVIDALAELFERCSIDPGDALDDLRGLWTRVRKPPSPDGGFTDRQLADRFLYGDLVHADELPVGIPTFPLRLYSAQGYLRDAVNATAATLEVIRAACDDGFLDLPPRAWSEAVTAGGQRLVHYPLLRMAHAPLGTGIPAELSDIPETWTVTGPHRRDEPPADDRAD
jgi:hypothetical protein